MLFVREIVPGEALNILFENTDFRGRCHYEVLTSSLIRVVARAGGYSFVLDFGPVD